MDNETNSFYTVVGECAFVFWLPDQNNYTETILIQHCLTKALGVFLSIYYIVN